MKVFEFAWYAGGYGNGVMLVVAETKEEAIEYATGQSTHWKYDDERTDLQYIGRSQETKEILKIYYQE